MDDDVKNLFQKIGQATSSYQEINRDADSEQAKQRWPLLRDVRVHAHPAVAHDSAQSAQSLASAALLNKSAGEAERKPVVKEFSGNLFARHKADAAQLHPVQTGSPELPAAAVVPDGAAVERPVPASLFKTPAVKPADHAAALIQPEAGRLNVFGNVASPMPSIEVSSLSPNLAEQTSPVEKIQPETDKNKAVEGIFKRLANKPEPEKMAEPVTNSFFKKIFRS